MTIDLRYEPRLGLALGGGGALGAAHVGVLQVLKERGIVPTIVAGTSAGSLIGGSYANGRDPYELEELVCRASWGDFGTFSMTPGIGLLDTDGLRATIEEVGSDAVIEDLPIRFAAVATDVGTQQRVLLDRGSLIEAVSASIAVPGIFKPRKHDGRTLVDGGLVDNLPIDVALHMGANHVIAVRLAPEWEVLPRLRTGLQVHEFEIRSDVTLIYPKLQHRSQWVARDLPGLVKLGREAAELALADYPVLEPRPGTRPDVSGSSAVKSPSIDEDAAAHAEHMARTEQAAHARGLAAFFRHRQP